MSYYPINERTHEADILRIKSALTITRTQKLHTFIPVFHDTVEVKKNKCQFRMKEK